MEHQDLTAERARELIDYDPATGIFIRRIAAGQRAPAGARADRPHKRGYHVIKIAGTLYRAHKIAWLIMTSTWPVDQVDHKDGDRANNRFGNLREATNQQNSQNRRCRNDSLSGAKGINWVARRGRWRARIHVEGKEIHLGMFKSAELAHAAYAKAAERYFGVFARAA